MLLSQKKASCVRCSLVLQTTAALLCFFSLQIAWHFKGRKFTGLNMQWTGKKKQLLCNTLRDSFVEPYVIHDPFSVPSTKILFIYGQSCDPFWVLVPYLKSLAELMQTSALPERTAGVALLRQFSAPVTGRNSGVCLWIFVFCHFLGFGEGFGKTFCCCYMGLDPLTFESLWPEKILCCWQFYLGHTFHKVREKHLGKKTTSDRNKWGVQARRMWVFSYILSETIPPCLHQSKHTS